MFALFGDNLHAYRYSHLSLNILISYTTLNYLALPPLSEYDRKEATGSRLWSSGLWNHVNLFMGTNFSKEYYCLLWRLSQYVVRNFGIPRLTKDFRFSSEVAHKCTCYDGSRGEWRRQGTGCMYSTVCLYWLRHLSTRRFPKFATPSPCLVRRGIRASKSTLRQSKKTAIDIFAAVKTSGLIRRQERSWPLLRRCVSSILLKPLHFWSG